MDRSKIKRAAAMIRRGGTVAFPTETVYGLGAHALDARAVAQIFKIKGRPNFDPLIVHVANLRSVTRLVTSFPRPARKLAEHFWPGPLTLVLPKSDLVPEIVTSGLRSVALRIPSHPLALALIRKAGVPIAAPSANKFGCISPTTADHVVQGLGEKVDFILDGGPCLIGVESTVISFIGKKPLLLRPGGIPIEEIEALIGKVGRPRLSSATHPLAPGMLKQHYAPQTRMVIGKPGRKMPKAKRVGLLSFRKPKNAIGFAAIEILSPSGDLNEAAANLFAAMRRLDARRLDLIVAEPVPERGLGRAIMDRLYRASHR